MKRKFRKGDLVNIVADTSFLESVVQDWMTGYHEVQPVKILRVEGSLAYFDLTPEQEEIIIKGLKNAGFQDCRINTDFLELHTAYVDKFEKFYEKEV
jgi:hypothetical protein